MGVAGRAGATELALLFSLVVACGLLRGVFSKVMREGGPWWPYFVTGIFTVSSWIWTAKRSPWPLLPSTVGWQMVYNLSWVGMTAFGLGMEIRPTQAWGSLVVAAGLILMAI